MFENFVLISLFTKPGWAGNKLMTEPIGSDFEEACQKPITRSMLNEVKNAAERALKSPAFGNVAVSVFNPSGNRLNIRIILSPPGTDPKTLMLSRYGGGWKYQAEEGNA